ncbi:MAG: choice-of-anchor B family protein, partial [Bacteroidota bacterium]
MRNVIISIASAVLLCCQLEAGAQWNYQNIDFMSRFDDPAVTAEPAYRIRYQSCWGWADPLTQREYGIIGSTAGTYIVEVTNPYQPVVRDYIPGRSTNRIWHEYKTYGNYLYIIADGGNNTLQIADLSYLPDSVHMVYDSTGIFDSGHTLFIDGDRMYVASVSKPGIPFSSMNVYSLDNPELPTLLRRLDQDFAAIGSVHDMFVTNDTVYASCGYDGLYVFRYDTIQNSFSQLGSLVVYPDAGYNHSTFPDASHEVLYMCDEVPDGMAVKVVDISDISNMVVVDTFYSNQGATPHNPYVLNNELFIAYYQDGVQAYDITDPRNPVRNGYFDTYPTNPAGSYFSPAYKGCWAVYTDLPSGNLLASDMQQGLFVLDISQVMASVNTLPDASAGFVCQPNPASDIINLHFQALAQESCLEIMDISGRQVHKETIGNGTTQISISTATWSQGIYLARFTNGTTNTTTR